LRDAERHVDESQNNDIQEFEHEGTGESLEQQKKRKRKESAALAQIKQSKEFARRKARRTGEPDDDDDFIAREMMYERSRPMPGQLDNCELCGKRFTVTPYSKTGPNDGLLCVKCSKAQTDSEKKAKVKKRGSRIGRRQNQSNLLDGLAAQGVLSLAEMCTKKVADTINDIEEFGDLPPQLLLRLSQILSKRRVMTPRTLNLFLRPDFDRIDIFDAAKLETQDFEKIFAIMPRLAHVNIRFAGQMKDQVVKYILSRDFRIKSLHLDAANLLSDTLWRELFQSLGLQLESLKLSNLDCSFDNETVEVLASCCTALRSLKLKHCWKLGNRSLQAISKLKSLVHLSLHFYQDVKSDTLLRSISQVGPNLQTLSLEGFATADDHLLDTIHDNCRSLNKLRFSDNSTCTDKGFVRLFTDWPNPALEVVDLSSVRDIDNANPDGPAEATGLASQGFVTLMNHSGAMIRKLNISSCRHISHAAFAEVFSDGRTYPNLRVLDVSFHTVMDDYLVGLILQCCPKIQKLIAFACFNLRGVVIPSGVALIGGLKAQDSIVLEGTHQAQLSAFGV
ncbi:DNA repair protein Rad7, protein, partial [Aspergillus saccharolyticus JOP 1030-1]